MMTADLNNWAQDAATDLLERKIVHRGTCLLLGAADTGKTSLAAALAGRLTSHTPIAFIDADVGQSHIGPPTTIGCALISAPCQDLTSLVPQAVAFVGDITPVGHLLQFTAALARCLAAAHNKADIVLIDTPGLIAGGAAAALWWTVHRLVQPSTIIALQRRDELQPILAGLDRFGTHIERISVPAALCIKTPEQRRRHRIRLYTDYFRQTTAHVFDLTEVTTQSSRRHYDNCADRLVALADMHNMDLALGAITRWDADACRMTVATPLADASDVRCIIVGDARVERD
ncbi:MAG TPA: Clp1/GlmU family protein [Anaerohalosphaeraceae bacterium]|jgi:polynucleotide 5'-hydroxyl-kinase GRC3/NOL9|nr:Clp1/GlmU family protein [Anaerohalosphaeraceae bacterium]HRT51467.1 Clp1/GlmU family protein [Anaerohalosphaeraceae bacterium]HRT87514.1 Clp1/GlmU family protein [Anaerohalosphaeraceae bacterium]